MTKPKFSVCIPTYNRANPLKRAIESVLRQEFDDYEIVISDNASGDNTRKMVQSFNKAKIRYFRNQKNLGMVKNWNRALKLARGEYIAFLHDDDEYRPNHLKEAERILSKYKNIGIYAAGNQNQRRPRIGLIEPEDYFRYIYRMGNVSPPSETIFIRKYNNKQYFYNDKDCLYSLEMALFLDIASDGFKTFHSEKQTVIRDKSLKEHKGPCWEPFKGTFKIIERYKNHKYIDRNLYLAALNFNINLAFGKYLSAKRENRGQPDEIFQGIKSILKGKSLFKYYELLFLKIFSDILIRYKLIDNGVVKKVYGFYKKKRLPV